MESVDKKVIMTKPVIHWMNMNYGLDQLEIHVDKKYPSSIFYIKNDKIVMELCTEKKIFGYHRESIWFFLQDFFGLEYKEIQFVLRKWSDQFFKIDNVTPISVKKGNDRWKICKEFQNYTDISRKLSFLRRINDELDSINTSF